MTNIDIREITIDDIVELQKISRQTFHETITALNSEENMAKYLTEELSIEKLRSEPKGNKPEVLEIFFNFA